MKKKMMVLVMVGMLALTFGASTVHAALSWYTVTVSEVGNSIGIPFITATDIGATFGPQIFFLNTADASALNQMMATALTGFANSTNLKIYTDPAQGTGATVFSVSASK